jgi:hypothetical protein
MRAEGRGSKERQQEDHHTDVVLTTKRNKRERCNYMFVIYLTCIDVTHVKLQFLLKKREERKPKKKKKGGKERSQQHKNISKLNLSITSENPSLWCFLVKCCFLLYFSLFFQKTVHACTVGMYIPSHAAERQINAERKRERGRGDFLRPINFNHLQPATVIIDLLCVHP